MTLTVSDVLEKAAELIEPEGRWTQNAFARDRSGQTVSWGDPMAVCWCARGAIARAADGQDTMRAYRVLRSILPEVSRRSVDPVANWQDAHDRQQSEVVAALRAAAEAARGAS